ncbi:probable protein phosphatase 2C 38 [Gastrolobium bilobum]|uniref:probable protein phosphatase 2C 38 n=1 Tax=Gastrolobium bilobum TaxID=150636 RepID=UPI002AB04601|nr:probable protein phosphatase 2C 38 [Gastrolobium bilobum]
MASATIRRIVSPCWRSSIAGEKSNRNGDSSGRVNGLLWYKDSGRHVNGEFSMAVVQANYLLEDQSQIESGSMSSIAASPQGTFVGIYDGHGGPEASRFVNDSLFKNIKKFTAENQEMSADVIHKAFLETEEEFLSFVRKQWQHKPQIASVGSCCLVGIICSGQLYIANAGDSRAVLGRLDKDKNEIKAVQLSSEHNASLESVRQEMRTLHPDDPQILVMKHKVWRVKGLIQVSRSIGDAYLKKAEFNKPPLLQKFRLSEPFEKPILLAEPAILVQKLYPQDQFLIFASDGLWEHLSNETAVEIVQRCPRNGVARKLIKTALCEAAKKREMRYSDLKKIDRGVRRHFHDDITVIVLFLDSHLISRASSHGPFISIKGAGVNRMPSSSFPGDLLYLPSLPVHVSDSPSITSSANEIEHSSSDVSVDSHSTASPTMASVPRSDSDLPIALRKDYR